MELTKLIMMGLGLIGVAITIPVVLLAISSHTNEGIPAPEPPIVDEAVPISTGLVVKGAACERDSDCVFAVNAYPYLRCISENCPLPGAPQPEPGDPAYGWVEAYYDSCVNANAIENQNSLGEQLIVDSRTQWCVCEAYASPDGTPTSADGQKLCTKKTLE